MPVYRATSPDGSAYDVAAPDGASEQDALTVAQAHHNALTQLSSASNSGAGNAQLSAAAGTPPPSASNDNFPRRPACLIEHTAHNLDDSCGEFHSVSGRNPARAGVVGKLKKLHHAV